MAFFFVLEPAVVSTEDRGRLEEEGCYKQIHLFFDLFVLFFKTGFLCGAPAVLELML